jgi:hypothetical protein
MEKAKRDFDLKACIPHSVRLHKNLGKCEVRSDTYSGAACGIKIG